MCLIFCDRASERLCFANDLASMLFLVGCGPPGTQVKKEKGSFENGAVPALMGQSVQIHVRVNHKCH